MDEIVERRTNLVHLGLCIDVEINNYLALDVFHLKLVEGVMKCLVRST